MDPFNPLGSQFETFDPYANEFAVTEAALYTPECDGPPISP
jgi:hypothetical protein